MPSSTKVGLDRAGHPLLPRLWITLGARFEWIRVDLALRGLAPKSCGGTHTDSWPRIWRTRAGGTHTVNAHVRTTTTTRRSGSRLTNSSVVDQFCLDTRSES